MRTTTWWDVAFTVVLPFFTGVLWLTTALPVREKAIVTGILAVVLACYWFFGRRELTRPRRVSPFLIIMMLGISATILFAPQMATLQGLAMPFIWMLTRRTAHAVTMNIVFVLLVGFSFWWVLGRSPDALIQTFFTEGLSLAFSLALGLWITHVMCLSQERAHLLAELQAAQGELALANREAGIFSERERLSREIHDTIAQSLTSLVMLAQRAQKELDRPEGHDRLADGLDLIESTARDALTETRSLVTALAPLPAGGSSLADVLERLTARFERETGVTVALDVECRDLPRDREVVILRCVQETLANVRKHAEASRVEIAVGSDTREATVTISDDGRGFASNLAEDDPGHGFGLRGMRDRLALVGGDLSIDSAPARGTRVGITVPLDPAGVA